MDEIEFNYVLDGETKKVKAQVLKDINAISSSPNYNIPITKFFVKTTGNSPAKWNDILVSVEPSEVLTYTPKPAA